MNYVIIQQQCRNVPVAVYSNIESEYRSLMPEENANLLKYLADKYNLDRKDQNSYSRIKIHIISNSDTLKMMNTVLEKDLYLKVYDSAKNPYETLQNELYWLCENGGVYQYFKNHKNIFIKLQLSCIISHEFYDFDKIVKLLSLCNILDDQLVEFPECIQGLISEYLVYFENELKIPILESNFCISIINDLCLCKSFKNTNSWKVEYDYTKATHTRSELQNLLIDDFMVYIQNNIDPTYHNIIKKFLTEKNIVTSVNFFKFNKWQS